MFVFRVCGCQLGSDIADLFTIGTRLAHAILRFSHLGRRDHFHGLGDLARVLHALNLGSYLFTAGHGCSRLFPDQIQ